MASHTFKPQQPQTSAVCRLSCKHHGIYQLRLEVCDFQNFHDPSMIEIRNIISKMLTLNLKQSTQLSSARDSSGLAQHPKEQWLTMAGFLQSWAQGSMTTTANHLLFASIINPIWPLLTKVPKGRHQKSQSHESKKVC